MNNLKLDTLNRNAFIIKKLDDIILEELNQKEKAIAAYREVLRLEPSFSGNRENLLKLHPEMKGQLKVWKYIIEKPEQPEIKNVIYQMAFWFFIWLVLKSCN